MGKFLEAVIQICKEFDIKINQQDHSFALIIASLKDIAIEEIKGEDTTVTDIIEKVMPLVTDFLSKKTEDN